LSQLSARRSFSGPAHRYDPADRVRGGNQSVARELARRLGARVRLRSPVVAVRHSPRGAEIACAGGHRHAAAAVVLALPLPLLLDLSLDPGLPGDVRAAAARTPFGDAAKLHIPLSGEPRPGGMAAAGATWWCWTSVAADGGPHAAPVLSCFAGGAAGIAGLGVDRALALRPDVIRGDGAPLLTHWAAEPWTRGSYSAPGVGLTAEDDAAWTRPWGAVVLAGEHTAGPRAGTMNGAAASGARAARTVLEGRDSPPVRVT
jgi:monoamine oxidase